jgi:hypothetical protein
MSTIGGGLLSRGCSVSFAHGSGHSTPCAPVVRTTVVLPQWRRRSGGQVLEPIPSSDLQVLYILICALVWHDGLPPLAGLVGDPRGRAGPCCNGDSQRRNGRKSAPSRSGWGARAPLPNRYDGAWLDGRGPFIILGQYPTIVDARATPHAAIRHRVTQGGRE